MLNSILKPEPMAGPAKRAVPDPWRSGTGRRIALWFFERNAMPEDKAQDSGFKVVDRRPFSVDGTRREGAERETSERSGELRTPAPASSAARADREPEEYLEPEGSGFETLVSYLSTTAMFQLGALPGPGGERIPADMVSARRTIDLLEVLEDKTRGNLTAVESRFLADVLYELRLTYVEVEKRGARKQR
jgi:hypothetical protein